jgi:cytochrome c oxidase assembly factor CtaG
VLVPDAAVARDELERELAEVASLDLAHPARHEVVVEELHGPYFITNRHDRRGYPQAVAHWSVEPLQVAPVLLLAALYARRVLTLRERGTAPPAWRMWVFGLGIVFLLAALVSPIDYYAERSFGLHMTQHILLGDLAPLTLLSGLTGPVLRPVLRFVHPVRRVFHPFAALALWGVDLYVWHLPFLYDAALRHDSVHALEHGCFFTGGILMWAPVLETIPMPEWFGTGWKLGYVAGVRVVEGILGNVFIWPNSVFYSFYKHAHAPFGMSAVNDQRLAGSVMMVEGSLVTIITLAWLFLRLAEEGELRQRLLESGLDARSVKRAVRYRRAQELEQAR